VRSVSAVHRDRPVTCQIQGKNFEARYTPGESETELFGGNSNWRGPIWFPVNFLLIEALERYHYYYGDKLKIDVPSAVGRQMTLAEASLELSRRLASLFVKDGTNAHRTYQGDRPPPWAGDDLLLFHEYFHGDTGAGLGASHQTGWTALVVRMLEKLAKSRRRAGDLAPPDQPRRLQSV
jgi:hypothetical protein